MFKPKTIRLNSEEELVLAEHILAIILAYPVNMTREERKTVSQYIKDIKTKESLLRFVVKLEAEPKTARQRYFFAMAFYKYSQTFLNEAIKYLALYVSNESFEEAYKENKMWFAGERLDLEALKGQHLADMCKLLGECHEANDDNGYAVAAYKEELKHLPYYPHAYERIANIYRKLNKPELIVLLYERAKESPFYRPVEYMEDGEIYTESGFKYFVDKKLEEARIY